MFCWSLFSVLFLVAVISLPLLVFMLSLSPRIEASTLSSMLTIFTNPSARAGYDTRSVLSGALQVLIQRETNWIHTFPRALVLCEMQSISSRIWTCIWSICWSSFLLYFKNGREYLTRGTAQVFIPLMRYILVRLWYSPCIFSFVYIFLHNFGLLEDVLINVL